MTKCIVLHSFARFSDEKIAFLHTLLKESSSLFAVVGIDCEDWEEAMDWLCIELDTSEQHLEPSCVTTSHPDETLEEVIAFAEQWCELNGWEKDIRVVETNTDQILS